MQALVLLVRMAQLIDDIRLAAAAVQLAANRASAVSRRSLGWLLAGSTATGSALPLAYISADLLRYRRALRSYYPHTSRASAYLAAGTNGRRPAAGAVGRSLCRRPSHLPGPLCRRSPRSLPAAGRTAHPTRPVPA